MVAHARGEGERICANGIVALAARALALYESGAHEELAEALALLDELAESATWATLRTYGHPTAELLRPAVGDAATHRWIALTQRRGDAFSTIACLRAELPVAAGAAMRHAAGGEAAAEHAPRGDVSAPTRRDVGAAMTRDRPAARDADPAALREVVTTAREVALRACAPALAAIADWAEAAPPARAGDVAALRAALSAAETLTRARRALHRRSAARRPAARLPGRGGRRRRDGDGGLPARARRSRERRAARQRLTASAPLTAFLFSRTVNLPVALPELTVDDGFCDARSFLAALNRTVTLPLPERVTVRLVFWTRTAPLSLVVRRPSAARP